MIPYGRQEVTQADIERVTAVLKSDFLTQGNAVSSFENKISQFCKAKFSVAVNSATSALYLACRALGLESGDVFWTSPITFAASANCGIMCDADVDFVDIDPVTFNMCPAALEEKMKQADKMGRLPKLIIVVHMAGQSADMARIKSVASAYGVRIIEDASHAIGAHYGEQPVGMCEYSDICVFSFHPVKIITTGEGGMITTNDERLFRQVELLRSHGITRNSSMMDNPSEGEWYYEQVDVSLNFRITDIQAALGISQMDRLEAYVERRHEIANRYFERLQATPLQLPTQSVNTYSSWHLFIIGLPEEMAGERASLFAYIRNADILCNVHYIPVPMHPFYKKLGFTMDNLPNAKNYYDRSISIPLYPTLLDKDQDYVIETIKTYFDEK